MNMEVVRNKVNHASCKVTHELISLVYRRHLIHTKTECRVSRAPYIVVNKFVLTYNVEIVSWKTTHISDYV